MRCEVKNCPSNTNTRSIKAKPVKFFRFPKDKNLQMEWLKVCRSQNINVQHARICSRHFPPEVFKISRKVLMGSSPVNTRKLLHDAIPSLEVDSEQSSVTPEHQRFLGGNFVISSGNSEANSEPPEQPMSLAENSVISSGNLEANSETPKQPVSLGQNSVISSENSEAKCSHDKEIELLTKKIISLERNCSNLVKENRQLNSIIKGEDKKSKKKFHFLLVKILPKGQIKSYSGQKA